MYARKHKIIQLILWRYDNLSRLNYPIICEIYLEYNNQYKPVNNDQCNSNVIKIIPTCV